MKTKGTKNQNKRYTNKTQKKNKNLYKPEVLLNIVSGKNTPIRFKEPKMQRFDRMYDDIFKTRRVVVNDSCHQLEGSVATSRCLLNTNIQNINASSQHVKQFAKKWDDLPLNSGFKNDSHIRGFQPNIYVSPSFNYNYYSKLCQFIYNNDKPENVKDDDVVYLDASRRDNSVTSCSKNSNSIITINDSCDEILGNSVRSEPTPDLSKFQIMVSNTEFVESKTVEKPEVFNDDSVIYMGTDGPTMGGTSQERVTDQNSDVITIDDDNSRNAFSRSLLPKPKLTIPMKNKQNLIRKKKNVTKNRNGSLKRSTRTKITFSEADSLMRKSLVTSSKPSLDCKSKHISNIYNAQPVPQHGLREIIIDGSNIALGHSNGTTFSVEGLKIVIDFFVERGHKVRAFVPQYRLSPGSCTNTDLLRQMISEKTVVLTPSRLIKGKRITPYDDRFIIQYATSCQGVVVSSDCYRDLIHESPEWRNTIENRLLMPTWVDNVLMFPLDPMGRFGPLLTEFLQFPVSK